MFVILFFIFYMFAVCFETKGGKNRNQILAFACIVLQLWQVFEIIFWPDALCICIEFSISYTNYF